ncbi:hypothetical protein EW026_g2193 [Hermanssonia centrifuga]|uniref:Uncharacterized protein n=1 Tax=Hermanssonia centrifuga TaxID=98765 RepID=A0A4S4KNZ6_9APHY|nr:hypothetical protein EW026_g2193 [Hermanssonia centrifuga]
MLEGDMKNLPPPTLPSTPPSPAGSNKEGGWLSAVKSRLTPTKEPLTPAQQIILDTKARDKEQEKEEKKLEKERKEIEKEIKKVSKKQSKQRSGEWSSSPEVKYADPALQQQEASVQAQVRHHPIHASSSSPTPVRQSTYSTPPSLAPSPRRSGDTISSSPSRQGPPVYAQFSPEGTLDIPSTLLTIATRFEKLERWTVGHVRALEERMDDVERWLVEKEKEPEQSTSTGIKRHQTGEPASVDAAIVELRDELTEVQGRIGELGREMAKMLCIGGKSAVSKLLDRCANHVKLVRINAAHVNAT